MLRLIPPNLFGEGADGILNRKVVMKHVDDFIKMRRFETLSLHELCKGLKVASIPWLACPTQGDQTQGPKAKMALSDFKKRTEIIEKKSNLIVAKSGFSWRSWGELITIIRDKDRILFNSICDPDNMTLLPPGV